MIQINPQFDINNLLITKYHNHNKNKIICFEVMEVQTQTCSAGTQIFYLCRLLIAEKLFRSEEWTVGIGMSGPHGEESGLKKFREDELVQAPDEVIYILLGTEKKENHDS